MANDVRQRVRELKKFYLDLSIYAIVSFFCVLVWISMGCGLFWPIWVILGFAIASLLEAMKLGQLTIFEEILPFLRPEWEEEQVQKIEKEKK